MSESSDDDFPVWLVLVIVCAVLTLIFCCVTCCVIRCFYPEQSWGAPWFATEDGQKQFVTRPNGDYWRAEGDNQLKQKKVAGSDGRYKPFQDNNPKGQANSMGKYPIECPDELKYSGGSRSYS